MVGESVFSGVAAGAAGFEGWAWEPEEASPAMELRTEDRVSNFSFLVIVSG